MTKSTMALAELAEKGVDALDDVRVIERAVDRVRAGVEVFCVHVATNEAQR